MRLQVGVDARLLNVPHIRGTGRYIYELLRHTEMADGIDWVAYAHDPSRALFLPEESTTASDIFEFRGHRLHLWEQAGLPWRARRRGVQVLHCADNTAPWWQPMPTIVTIHDTVPWTETQPGTIEHHYLHHLQPAALRRCGAIITISESSRRDIVSRWPDLESRLRVIPHGIADEFFDAEEADFPVRIREGLRGAPYLVYLGGPHPRKRFEWAVRMLEESGMSAMHLVACGFSEGTAPAARLPEAMRGRVHFPAYLKDGELAAVYRNAVAAVYPTTYEGFGFPAIESQASGTPVIFSPTSSLAELLGPMAFPVELADMGSWQRALKAITDLPRDVRSGRAAEARQWARGYSWRASIEKHVAIYREVHDASVG